MKERGLATYQVAQAYIGMAFTRRFTCSLIRLFGYSAIRTFWHGR